MAISNNPNGTNSVAANFLPNFYKTDSNKKFLQATVDQIVQPGAVKKINGFIGRKTAKAAVGDDVYIEAPTDQRQDYQLEPSFTVKDALGNPTFFKDYQDYINQINVFGGNTTNHARLNAQEFYSWDPHIDWDKFVNFQSYYWLPYGPDTITIFGQQKAITSTYTVELQTEGSDYQYLFTPNGLTPNPVLTLYRGQTYVFDITSPGNPFSIKVNRNIGKFDRYTSGVTGAGVVDGRITFEIPLNAPSTLYYQSETDRNLGGVIKILDITEDTYIDVAADLLGKKSYTLSNGTRLSNGMKVSFGGNVTPAEYETGEYYVEGVGSAIKLINKNILEIVTTYTATEAVYFDSIPFDSQPFGDSSNFASTKDYITINRASRDHNPWSRYNRWFHKDTIESVAAYLGNTITLDQASRAVRPIIEFNADLKLFNFGTLAVSDVDVIDTFTKDAFSTIEGSRGYNVDGVPLAQGQLVLFTADTDRLVKNNIYRVTFTNILGYRQIHLEPVTQPALNNVVLIRQGKKNQGQMYWYNGTTWKLSQQKTNTNQAPLFDIVDNNKISYGDTATYPGTNFIGTSIFSYKIASTGVVDTSLGFRLTYKNINNIGDIVFNFTLATDSFQYKLSTTTALKTVLIKTGYLISQDYAGNPVYQNGWQRSVVSTAQAGVRVYKNSNLVNNFPIDIFDNVNDLSDLLVKVYVNGIRLDSSYWAVVNTPVYKQIKLTTAINLSDILTIKVYANQPINDRGYYEIPINLQNNPMNDEIGDFTLGEVSDHVGSIIDNIPEWLEVSEESSATRTIGDQTFDPDHENIRDLGNITPYGTKFVQHSGPASLSIYHTTSEINNIVRAIEKNREDYSNFKKNFINIATQLGIDSNPVNQVDMILNRINKDKPKTFPYYFSDMVPYGSFVQTVLTVVDHRIKSYPLTNVFSLGKLSNQAVGVYLNGFDTGTQLLYGRDYTFDQQGFVVLTDTVPLQNNNTITIREYDDTDGSFVPETPSKLGIWPKYEPSIYLDTSLVTPVRMIQGHDGSQVAAYNDYRDAIILELEKRIYNNIKVEYNTSIYDIADTIPSYNRTNAYSINEFNNVLAPSFYKWATLVDKDFTKPLKYDLNNSFTYNYAGHSAPNGSTVPGYWRGVYRWLLDTDRPHICPWEMLGFTEQPSWWIEVYGPAPYSRDNRVMWQDIADGVVRAPGAPAITLTKYVKTFLMNHIPVDETGNLLSPLASGLARGTVTQQTANDFVFGDVGPVEAAWRRSSHFPFSTILASMILTPANTFGVLLDRSRIIRNLAGQLVYSDTNLRIKPSNIKLPNITSSSNRIQTAGVINYLTNYILSDNLKSYTDYQYDLTNLAPQISYRVGGFTSKQKFNLLLDSKTYASSNVVFIPQDDYNIILNSSSPVKKIVYSGVIITKVVSGYEVKGYSQTQPFFKYYQYTQSGVTLNVGGISEKFNTWTELREYAVGTIVKLAQQYYRVLVNHTTTTTFEPKYYQALSKLPIIGGRDATFRKLWDRTNNLIAPYGTTFTSVQEVVDFLLGYGEYLKDQGFVFDEFNKNLGAVTNWETSAKEFMFWTTQNWSSGADKWTDWRPNVVIPFNSIIKYNGDYYRSVRNVEASSSFDATSFIKLDNLSTIGSGVISLSPSADKITFNTTLAVVDDIGNPFNGYEIFKVDGTPLEKSYINSFRSDNAVSYSSTTNDGIYGASFYLVQKEQVLLLNNSTMFNDTIYSPASGYRQERITVAGYVSVGWTGGFDAPGFIFDEAVITEWQPWKDYNIGELVKFGQFYLQASPVGNFVPGAELLDQTQWLKLANKPSPKLIPNWTYKAAQFTDFYSLDSDNFDATQQQMAQHLIGYQKRSYLDNIIKDDVSEFKFYQGMIREKGTQNSLNKLFDVLSADGKESLTFKEEWAIRLGQYGASGAFENIEFILDEGQFKINPQGFYLVSQPDPNALDYIIRQTSNNVYLKPLGYTSTPWPVLTNYQPYLRSAGYVRASEVFVSLKTISDIVNYDVTNFNNGSYVSCAFEGTSWNVYRFTDIDFKVTDITYDSNVLTITLVDFVGLPVGTWIGISQTTNINGFYKITSVTLNSFTVSATPANWETFAEQSTVIIYALLSQRTASIDNIDDIIPRKLATGEILWTDNSGDGTWATWTYDPVYSQVRFFNSTPATGLNYGRSVAINAAGNILGASTANGEIVTWDKASVNTPWIQRQLLTKPLVTNQMTLPSQYATVMAFSNDGTWLATSSPTVGYAHTRYRSTYDLNTSNYITGDIVSTVEDTTLYQNYINDLEILKIYFQGANYTGPGYPASAYSYDILVSQSQGGASIPSGWIPAAKALQDSYKSWQAELTNIYFYKALRTVPTNTAPPIGQTSNLYWASVPYIPVDESGTASGLPAQGVVHLYKKDSDNIYTLVDSFVSPNPQPNELFGSSIRFFSGVPFGSTNSNFTDQIIVGAPGSNSVYKFAYGSVGEATSAFNPVGTVGGIIAVTSTVGILPGMTVTGTGFTGGQTVTTVLSSTKLELTGSPNSTPSGILTFSITGWFFNSVNYADYYAQQLAFNFGANIVVSGDAKSAYAITSAGGVVGKITIITSTGYQVLSGTKSTFGTSIALSNDGTYLVVSDPLASGTSVNQGAVYVYKRTNSSYTLYQTIVNHSPENSGFFGSKVAFMSDRTLVVYSSSGDTLNEMTFDQTETTFDKKSTTFITRQIDSGKVDIYDNYSSKWVFSETLTTTNTLNDGYGTGFAVGLNHIIVGAPTTIDQTLSSGAVYDYYKLPNKYTWTKTHTEIVKPDVTKIKKAFLYNRTTGELVKHLDVIDPLQGKIAGPAAEEITFSSFYDPAEYTIGDDTVIVNADNSWTTKQVGKLWWDLRTTKFIDPYDGEVVYRTSNWNTLATGATVDVYEWVSSVYKPADWDNLADTEAGLAKNISGLSLYGNTAYSISQTYDTTSQSYRSIYYFWVKNKTIVPNVTGRYISAAEVASLIANPRGQGYEYLSLTGINSFNLTNVKSMLTSDSIVLSIEYWTTDKTDRNVHSHWKIISDEKTTVIPTTIEQKWFDSLCGRDSNGLPVPDLKQPIKLRYGIENRPRQSMFVNRFEALKQFIEQVNITLAKNQIVQSKNLTNLEKYDAYPDYVTLVDGTKILPSGLYDTAIDTDAELPYVGVGAFKRPNLTPIIVDGRITGITINSAGIGYLYPPFISIVGSGTGAVIRATINTLGQITGATISSAGEGYDTNTVAVVRDYSVLVYSDSQSNSMWAIYSYDPTGKVWSRIKSKTYDVRDYWEYTDWYATGYNQFSAADYGVDTFDQLNYVNPSIGQLVLVRTSSTNGWQLLYRYAVSASIDWTQSYRVVGVQKGTIQFKSSFYQFFDTSIGYDDSTFDGAVFDGEAVNELRFVLIALKNDILTDDLKQQYIDLFFTSVRYALSEQVYIDWIFKTSFVKAQHNLGELRQPVTYQIDNLSNFQEYVSEVKPYRTKVREYISAYSKIDDSRTMVSDFDLPTVYDNNKIVNVNTWITNGKIQADNAAIQTYPWKNWLDNVGFIVTELRLVNGGDGYITEPVVKITSDSGSGATARAFFANGKVNRIVLLTNGSKYLSAPTVTLNGGLSATGTAARVVAVIGNSVEANMPHGVVRSSLVKIKFDRLTQSYYITQLQQTETFAGSGSKLQFNLTWAPDIKIGNSTVTITSPGQTSEILVLRDLYTLAVKKSTKKGYTSYSGTITFATAPANLSTIKVTYIKDWDLLNAADRTQFYYDPITGQIGNDLSQLMSGVDYGGVTINGLGFDVAAGWGALPYYTDKWDTFDATYSDYIVTVAAGVQSFTLPYTPSASTILNVYHVRTNTLTYTSNGLDVKYSYTVSNRTPTITASTTQTALAPVTLSGTAGTRLLRVNSTTNISVGDTVTCSAIAAFSLNTTVTSINSGTNTVTLSQILYLNVPTSSSIIFTRTLVQPTDFSIFSNGNVTLAIPLLNGIQLNIITESEPMRLDDPNYGTVNQINTNAIMSSITASGSTATFTIPNTFTVLAGDKFIWRQSTSDGSIKPQDTDYDTALTGGNLAYSTATGLSADDILVDGDGLVTPTTSPAPEEVVPGQVVDAVAIKVFDQPIVGSANIKVDNYLANGSNNSFAITQTPSSPRAVVVKVGSTIKQYTTDYTVDYKNKQVNFTSAPAANSTVSIFSLGFSGDNILDIDYFIANGATLEFITKAPWLDSVTSLIYLNGVAISPKLFKTDNTYVSANRIGIQFSIPPAVGSVINYIIVSGNQQTFAITKTELVPTNGSSTYALQYPIGDALPLETNIIVRVNQSILTGPNNSYFTIANSKLDYTIDPTVFLPYSVAIGDIRILANGKLLTIGSDYIINLSGITVSINQTVYDKYLGKQLIVSIVSDQQYTYNPVAGTITFKEVYDNTNVVEVISSYKHDVLDIQRTDINVSSSLALTPDTVTYFYYKSITGGILSLDRSIINDSYVWVVKNGTLLTPAIDYKLNDDRVSITLASNNSLSDKITLITYGSNVLTNGIAYMQFKDMLNRVHFKRLNRNKETYLVTALRYNDATITVADASSFDLPNTANNKPGIIEIRGERIEFFAINGNVLSKLRRGTLGTGTPTVHNTGSWVQEIGASETIPYVENTVTEQIISDGTNTVNLNIITPTKASTTWSYSTGYVSSIPAGYGQSNDIDVFVGGYDTSSVWAPKTLYAVGIIVTIGSYTYQCKTAHTSSAVFTTDTAKWTFFIGNIRLKKKPYMVHNINQAPDSPEGDIQLDADFAVNGSLKQVRLTNRLAIGTQVTVVKRQGIAWDSTVNILNDSTDVAKFLKSVPGTWYKDFKQ
jgi:hypothetical protein